ncbi:MAG: hypothetical protein ABSG32_26975 [Terriglobia bacterium]
MDSKELAAAAVSKMGRRLSVGFSLAMSEEEHHALLAEFGSNIYELYFSPPLGPQYHTRPQDHQYFQQPGVEEMFWRVLEHAKGMGIRLCLSLNQITASAEDMILGAKFVEDRLGFNSIVTLRRHAKALKAHFPDKPFWVSYNDGVDSARYVDKIDPEVFYGIVPGRSTLRNFPLFRYIRAQGLRVKFMLNTGCSYGCELCLCRNCYRPRNPANEKVAALTNWDERYALQTLLPWELHEHGYLECSDIDIFKVCSRPSKYVYLRAVLESYLYNKNEEMRTDGNITYSLWARGNILPPHFQELDYGNITAVKRQLWQDEAYLSFARPNG